MGVPTILFASSGSSDTTASGAGPATSHNGTTGRTRNSASQTRFGLFGYTGDLSNVPTDGTAALFAAIATAGQRNFSSISAVKDTRQTGTDGAMTSGSAILTVGSTTGWGVGDVVKVNGAGAASADLYSTVSSVDSGTQATLADTASTTVGPSASWENPKQVTLTTGEGLNTGATNTQWGIGGKRATLTGTNSAKLYNNNNAAGDAMPAWIMEMESGYTETVTGTMIFRRNGDATGRVTLRGTPAAASRPILTFNFNGVALQPVANYTAFEWFELRNSHGTKTASVAFSLANATFAIEIRNVKVSSSGSNFWRGLSGSNTYELRVSDCDFGYFADSVVANTSSALYRSTWLNNWIHDCTNAGVVFNSSMNQIVFMGNIVEGNGGDGVTFNTSAFAGTASTGLYLFDGNTFDGNTSDGMDVQVTATSSAGTYDSLTISNNFFTNNGAYGLKFSGASVTDAFLKASSTWVVNNGFYGNTTDKYSPALTLTSQGEQTSDPGYVNRAGNNFCIGPVLKAKGYPVGGALAVGAASSTYSYRDIGVAQREEPGGAFSMFPGGQLLGL